MAGSRQILLRLQGPRRLLPCYAGAGLHAAGAPTDTV